MLKVRFHGKAHIHNGPCRAFHVHIGVDAILSDAKSYIIGNNHGVALGGKDSLKREGLRRAFGI